MGFLEGFTYFLACDWFDEWDGVLVSEDSAYAAGVVAFFGEFNYECFYFFGFVFAPAWGTSADWAN